MSSPSASNSSSVNSSSLTVAGPNHCAGFAASITAELNMINATTAKKRIPFFLVFTVEILNFHVISDCYKHHKSFKSPVILSIFSSGAGPMDIQVIVPGAICV